MDIIYKQVLIALEKENHFSDDELWYKVIIKTELGKMAITISKAQFELFAGQSDIPAYETTITPFETVRIKL